MVTKLVKKSGKCAFGIKKSIRHEMAGYFMGLFE